MIEVRAPGMHKGAALRTLVDEQEARAFVFGGDDLGDVEAFEAVRSLRAEGLPGLLVCSASEERERPGRAGRRGRRRPRGRAGPAAPLTADIRAARA